MTVRIPKILLCVLLGTVLVASPVFSLDDDVSEKFPSTGDAQDIQDARAVEKGEREEEGPQSMNPVQRVWSMIPSSVLQRFDWDLYVDVQQGYDNNVGLDSRRLSDGFSQIVANTQTTYALTDSIHLNGGTDFFNILYYNQNDDNIFDLAPYAGFDVEINRDVVWYNKFTFDWFWYPNYKEDTFVEIRAETSVRHYLLSNTYHQLTFEYTNRWYPDRKIFTVDGRLGNNDRRDERYKGKYRIAMFYPKFIIRLDNEFYYNDSDDMYQDYYDYWVYRVRPGFMYFFTDKFYADASLIYKYTDHDDRRSTANSWRTVKENLFVFNGTLFYDLTSNITMQFSYSYSENVSNEPIEQYSGSIITAGFYYNF